MSTLTSITLVWLLAAGMQSQEAMPVEAMSSSALVYNALTVDGTAKINVLADACRVEFVISGQAPTAEDALANLKPSREQLTSVVTSVIGGSTDIEFGAATVTKRERKQGEPAFLEATQTASVMLDYFPKEPKNLDDFLMKITAAVMDSGVAAGGVPQPSITFEISHPEVLEGRLVDLAAKDASRRATAVAKSLERRIGELRGAHFPSTVTVGNRAVSIAAGSVIECEKPEVTLTYVARVAFQLER